METSDEERREVAERLRELAAHPDIDGNVYCGGLVDCGLLQRGSYRCHTTPESVEHMADLIDRPTCHNVDHADEYGFVCSQCGSYAAGAFGTPYDEYRRRIAEASVSLGLDPREVERAVGPSGTRVPWFCPLCGAKVVHDA